MKTILFIPLLATTLFLGADSFAATQGNSGKNFQPSTSANIIIVSDEFAGKKKLEALLQKLNDPDPFVRVEVVQSLGEIQIKEVLVPICDCLDDENPYVRAYAAEALGKVGQVDNSLTLSHLLPALDDPSPYVRAMMVRTLGELQDERAVDSVRERLHDEDESVRKMAVWALNKIENPQ